MNTYVLADGFSAFFSPYISYFSDNTSRFIIALREHLLLSGEALLAAGVAGVFFGILCGKNKTLNNIITGFFSAARIIPSLAILFLCLPILGTGVAPSIAALTFLAAPPILINTAASFAQIPKAMVEAACAMGMTPAQIFFRIKAPLALPLILAGFKTAAVEIIASATLAAYIGGGGLGVIIFTGLGLMKTELLVIGGVSVALLSLLTDFLLSILEKKLRVYLYGA
ncbi:MAG: ABC transporter permease [Spirochaetaceae bacterium]|jgi:osmoprotectant transport system permease protein|nr:ABC transporter permease [Spirochaetaceae bacterium]